MLIFKTILNCILIGVLLGGFTGIALSAINKAHKYRKKYGFNFKDKLLIRILELAVVIIIVIAFIIFAYFADRFGNFVCENSDLLALTFKISDWEILILSNFYMIAGRFIMTFSFILAITAVIIFICALDSFIIHPEIKIDENEIDKKEDEEEL